MKDRLLIVMLCLASLFSSTGNAQEELVSKNFERDFQNQMRAKMISDYALVKPFFEEAYALNASIPRGFLESVAFQYTRFAQDIEWGEESSQSIPRTYSVMGLTYDGKGYFRDNLKLVSKLSGVSESDIFQDNRLAILAYAAAFAHLQEKYACYGDSVEKYKQIFIDLSELPLPNSSDRNAEKDPNGWSDQYPLNSFLYVIYKFLSDTSFSCVGSPAYAVNMEDLFGEYWSVLVAPNLNFYENGQIKSNQSADYESAVWTPAASCNYSSGRGNSSVSNVTIHYTAGTYAGAIAWFKNCSAQASAHYLIRSIDGQITQMVRESDKAWHVGVSNAYSIGIEHEAYGNVESFFTLPMYQSSANLVQNICSRYPNMNSHHVFYRDTLDDGTVLNSGLHNLGGASACTQIRGHQHFPNQSHTDPGPFWNWNYYYKLINSNTQMILFTADTGLFTDSGGLLGDYGDNERKLYHFHLEGADSVVLDFTSFSLEPDYDFMWLYAGTSVFAPQVGRWNTNSPGRVAVPGEDLVVEFRSDCAIAESGWVAHWHGCYNHTQPIDQQPPTTAILLNDMDWYTGDFVAPFEDSDDVALKYRFYQVMEKAGSVWKANANCGFLCDNFDGSLDTSIWHSNGDWQVVSAAMQSPNSNAASFVSTYLRGDAHDVYLYDFYMSFEQGEQGSFYFGCNQNPVDNNHLSGYQVLFDKSEHALKIYRINNGARTQLKRVDNIYYSSQQSFLYRVVWNRIDGEILVFRHAAMLASAEDSDPMTFSSSVMGFSSTNSVVRVDNVRVYGSRVTQAFITVGQGQDKMIRVQSISEGVAAKVKSVVLDEALKFSSLVEKTLKVDFTKPTVSDPIDIGLSVKQNMLNLIIRWPYDEDEHSGLKEYSYRVTTDSRVTSLTSTNSWISIGLDTLLDLPFVLGPCFQKEIVDASARRADLSQRRNLVGIQIRSQNNAGLYSDVRYVTIPVHDGQGAANAKKYMVYPNPCHNEFWIEGAYGNDDLQDGTFRDCKVSVYDLTGRLLVEKDLLENCKIDLSQYPVGMYIVKIWRDNECVCVEKILKK